MAEVTQRLFHPDASKTEYLFPPKTKDMKTLHYENITFLCLVQGSPVSRDEQQSRGGKFTLLFRELCFTPFKQACSDNVLCSLGCPQHVG